MSRNISVFKHVFRYLILVLWSVVIILPIYWVITSSFKPIDEVFTLSIPTKLIFESYIIPYREGNYLRFYVNSLLFASVATCSTIFLSSLAGYGFAKFKFFGRSILFIFVLSTMMISIHVTMIPLFLIMKKLNWLDTFQGLVAPFLVNAFGIFLMRQNIIAIPDSYIDAARLDGASEIKIYIKIILPLCKPILATLGILNFTACWDEFLWALIITKTAKTRTLPVGLSMFFGEHQTPTNQVFAVVTTAIVPLLIFYLIAQKFFVESLSIAGLKE